MASAREQKEALDRAVKFVDDSREHMGQFYDKVDQRSDAYHALQDRRKDKGWRSQLFPPFAMHIVDTTLASMVEDRLRFRIKPRAQLWDLEDDPTAAMERAQMGAEAHQILQDWQIRQSKWTRVQRPFLLQNAIAGITVAKNFWQNRAERRRFLKAVEKPLLDDMGDPIFDPLTGQGMTYSDLEEETRVVTIYDGPVTEVVDVHDFCWPKNAIDMSKARYVGHRVWLSMEELESGFSDEGPYGPENGGWSLAKVRKIMGDGKSVDERGGRWSQKESDHDYDKVEVWEVWDQYTKEVITFANDTALLAFKGFPFFHEQPPFVVATTQPDLFSIVGISQVEKVAALQQMLWDLGNQSLDNLQLVNNAIVIFNPAMESMDELPFYPGAQWPLEDPELVQMWQPNPIPAEISMGREAQLKGDMQNLAATFPFSSGAESQTVDQKTATGASIVSALAQRSIDLAKQGVFDAWEDCGNQRLILNQQFIREPVAASVLGLDGKEEIKVVMPELLAGDFEFVLEPMPDALVQQQEQAQAQALVQVMGQLAPVLLPLAQAGAASMINFDAVIEFYLKSLGIEDTKQFFVSKAPAAQLPQQGSPGAAGGDQTVGITGDGSVAPEVSPGAQISSSPVTNMQRSAALSGGGRNA